MKMTEARQPRDHATRLEVIEPGHSFAVQAPAGSGKTELLTQRFLRLLADVRQPQQVLAITFTRKATREMADRVLMRLREADSGVAPEEAHKLVAYALAQRVLERDTAEGWNLLEQPGQLQIHTIDGLCARLAARGGGTPQALDGLAVAEHPEPMYQEAARRAIEAAVRAPEGDPVRVAVEDLLVRERGNANQLQELLAGALSRRDQWLSELASGLAEDRAPGEQVLAARQHREVAALERLLGRDALQQAGQALAALAPLADDPVPGDGLPAAWARLATADSAEPQARAEAYWWVLRRLGKKDRTPWSASWVNRSVYPGKAQERAGPIGVLQGIVTAWNETDAARAAFQRFLSAPPLDRSPGDTRLVDDLKLLLAAAYGHLLQAFTEAGACDFQQIAQLALASLGDDDDPGEALLIEDGRLEHILIDEFQDTSQLQFDLVERLLAGWTEGDGRSLFLVGDPMQSIYGFRKADVSLFEGVIERACIGEVPLRCRTLEVNFRSTSTVIDRVNTECSTLFRRPFPTSPGHVDYQPVEAFEGEGGAVRFHAVPPAAAGGGETEEARWIAARTAELLESGTVSTVGILARKRAQLEPIAQQLTERGVAFEAVEVQSLARRPVVLDLLTLTRALLHPGDRVAWLGVLLAPWCALGAAELLAVAGEKNDADLLSRCLDPSVTASLDGATRRQVERLARILGNVQGKGALAGVAERVEAAWIRLGGPRVARNESDLEDAEVFLRLLSRIEREAPDDLLGLLEQRLEKLFAGSRPAPVQLMTIHKAKGLEFDAVFLPALQGRTGQPRRELFRQKEFRLDGHRRGSLLAPLKSAGADEAGLYDYLGRLQREEQDSEAQRLLYVAMTRARRHLHLSAICETNQNGELSKQPGSFLEMLRASFEAVMDSGEPAAGVAEGADASGPSARTLPGLVAASSSLAERVAELADGAEEDGPLVTLGDPPPARERLALGEALHHWLELIHDHWHDARWSGDWTAEHGDALRASLQIAGAPREALGELEKELVDLLRGLLADPGVREVLSPEGKRASTAEAVYLVPDGARLGRRIIDRLYQDADGAWHVVDYKSGAEASETRQKWREQLAGYADAVTAAEDGVVASARILQAADRRFIDPERDEPDDSGAGRG